jgi:hypothetical protein
MARTGIAPTAPAVYLTFFFNKTPLFSQMGYIMILRDIIRPVKSRIYALEF